MPGTPMTPYQRRIPLTPYNSGGVSPTRVQNTGNPYIGRSAALSTVTFSIPLCIDHRSGEIGAQLDAIDIPFRLATENAVSTITMTVYRRNTSIPVVGTPGNITASTVAGTLTGSGLTANSADRLLHWVPTTPALDYSSDHKADYTAQVTFNLGTTSALRVYDPIVYFSIPS